jgi:hypothetical protein
MERKIPASRQERAVRQKLPWSMKMVGTMGGKELEDNRKREEETSIVFGPARLSL